MVHGANIILCKPADFVRAARESISACITIADAAGKGKQNIFSCCLNRQKKGIEKFPVLC